MKFFCFILFLWSIKKMDERLIKSACKTSMLESSALWQGSFRVLHMRTYCFDTELIWRCLILCDLEKWWSNILKSQQNHNIAVVIHHWISLSLLVSMCLTLRSIMLRLSFFFSFVLDWAALSEWKCSFIRPDGGGFIYFQYAKYKLICYSKEEGEERQQTWGQY